MEKEFAEIKSDMKMMVASGIARVLKPIFDAIVTLISTPQVITTGVSNPAVSNLAITPVSSPTVIPVSSSAVTPVISPAITPVSCPTVTPVITPTIIPVKNLALTALNNPAATPVSASVIGTEVHEVIT